MQMMCIQSRTSVIELFARAIQNGVMQMPDGPCNRTTVAAGRVCLLMRLDAPVVEISCDHYYDDDNDDIDMKSSNKDTLRMYYHCICTDGCEVMQLT